MKKKSINPTNISNPLNHRGNTNPSPRHHASSSPRHFFMIAVFQLSLLVTFVIYLNSTFLNAGMGHWNGRSLSAVQSSSAPSLTTTTDAAIQKSVSTHEAVSAALSAKVDMIDPKPKNYRRPDLVWLMSFPNSGTAYTMKLISRLSQTYVATNYGQENKMDRRPSFPVFNDQADVGPFWIYLTAAPNYTYPKDLVLVKTHCGGRCEICDPIQYADTTYSFRRACTQGQRRIWVPKELPSSTPQRQGNAGNSMAISGTTPMIMKHVNVHYPVDRVTRAIHLIRDPFDNIVSLFHMETKENRSGDVFRLTREGFRSFCQNFNQQFSDEQLRSALPFDGNWLNMTQHIPCGVEFFRWIEWHNQAFYLTEDLNLDTMVLKYESFSTNMNETCNALLEFLNLPRRSDPEPFITGEQYSAYFTLDERRMIGQLIHEKSTRIAWQHLANYFH